MAYCRKVAVKKLHIETYNDFAKHLVGIFLSLGSNSDEIHMIFDNYTSVGVLRKVSENAVANRTLKLNSKQCL